MSVRNVAYSSSPVWRIGWTGRLFMNGNLNEVTTYFGRVNDISNHTFGHSSQQGDRLAVASCRGPQSPTASMIASRTDLACSRRATTPGGIRRSELRIVEQGVPCSCG